jgi:carboxyl-terminal processing protease
MMSLTRTFSLLFLISVVQSSALVCAREPVPILNPGFEELNTEDSTKIQGWRLGKSGGQLRLDRKTYAGGRQALEIKRGSNITFSTIIQTIDADKYRGKLLILNAKFMAAEPDANAAGLWIRVDGKTIGIRFSNIFGQPMQGRRWITRQVVVEVPDEAEKVSFGASISAEGSLWVDDFELFTLEISAQPPSNSEVRNYLQVAIDLIRKNALKSPTIDWARAESIAYSIARESDSIEQSYLAVKWLVENLDDGHSRFSPLNRSAKSGSKLGKGDKQIVSKVISNFAYLSVPAFSPTDARSATEFSTGLQNRIVQLNTLSVCGWIVDLRGNTGGNMWPMLSGLAPLLGEGIVGYFISQKGEMEWRIHDNTAWIGPTRAFNAKSRVGYIQDGKAPVAVLTDSSVASSGEAVTVAFRGRENARSFGQPTSGLSTGVQPLSLPDGAQLLLATSNFADRRKNVFGQKINPDELVDETKFDPSDDKTMQSAIVWLNSLEECKDFSKSPKLKLRDRSTK